MPEEFDSVSGAGAIGAISELQWYSLNNSDKSASAGTLTRDDIQLRPPSAADGPYLHKLVAQSPPLDPNSIYCNLLQCSHFANTAAAAELNGKLVGFVSGYRIPDRPDTYFLWQVVVAEAGRGRGLAKRMIVEILSRPALSDIHYLETTVTPDNEASWALFRGFARDQGAELVSEVHFTKDIHFHGAHDEEHLLRIGPFDLHQGA